MAAALDAPFRTALVYRQAEEEPFFNSSPVRGDLGRQKKEYVD
jgi:hypothetical protein